MCISLRPPIYVMGSNVNMGSFGVTGVNVIYIKTAITLPCYIAWSYMVTLTYPLASDPLSHLQDQQANWGQSGVEVSKPAGYAVCDGNVSSFFFNCSILIAKTLKMECSHYILRYVLLTLHSAMDSCIFHPICTVLSYQNVCILKLTGLHFCVKIHTLLRQFVLTTLCFVCLFGFFFFLWRTFKGSQLDAFSP